MSKSDSTTNRGLSRVVPDRLRRRYAAKLAVAFFIVILLISTAGVVIYFESQSAIAQDTNQQLEQSAVSNAETLSEWTGRMTDEARLLSQSQPLRLDDTTTTSQFLEREISGDGRLPSEVIALHVVNTTRFEIVASTNSDFVGVNPRKKGVPWAQQRPSFDGPDDTIVTSPFVGPKVNKPVFAIISPVPDKNRVLVFMIDLEDRTNSIVKPSDGFVQVVNSEGTIVMSHRTDHILSQNMGENGVNSPAVEQGLNGQRGTLTMDMNGTTMVMGYAHVEGTDWVVMSHVPKQSAFALQRSISRNLLILVVASALGLGAIGLTIGRNTVRSINGLTAKAEAIEYGDYDVDLRVSRVDEIGQLHDAFGRMRDSLQETIRDAEEAQERAEHEQRQSQALVDHLETKADAYSAIMEEAADGDLSVRLDSESESAAMTQIADAFNQMVAELEETIIDIQQFADEVAASTGEVTASAGEVESASENVSESVMEISAGVDHQQENLDKVSNEMQNLSGTIEEVAASANQVATTAQRAAERGAAGQRSATGAIGDMEAIEGTAAETADQVEVLADEIDEVGEIVELIGDIAEQTNILALNASIEAARAGEAGDGFAVVADEVKTLAEEAAGATEQIEERIGTIQAAATDSVDDMQEMNERVATGTDTIKEGLQALEEIAGQVEEVNHGVQEISDATDEQASSTTEVVSMIDEVASVAERTSAEAGDVSAAAEEQAASLTEVADNTESLAEQAEDLQARLAVFTVNRQEVSSAGEQDDSAYKSNAAADGGSPDGE